MDHRVAQSAGPRVGDSLHFKVKRRALCAVGWDSAPQQSDECDPKAADCHRYSLPGLNPGSPEENVWNENGV
jgi:hypothetical protein